MNSLYDYLVAMYGAGKAMPTSEMRDLLKWEKTHLDGIIGTADWPGWVKYIGPKPNPPNPNRPKRNPQKQNPIGVHLL